MSRERNRKTVKLGAAGPDVFPLALGCMAMSGMYGKVDDAESIATIHAAMDAGVNLFDTGDFYGSGHNELVLGRALVGHRERALVSVKFGALRGPDGAWLGIDTRPAAVKNFASYSLRRLGVDVIDVYRPSRLDPAVPIEETIGAVQDLVKAGHVRYIGLSELGADSIRRAHAVHPVVDLQIEYAVVSRSPEAKIFPALKELGVSATLYGVLSRGLLSGSKPASPGDFRGFLPRFSADARERNDAAVAKLHGFAREHGLTPVKLAFAWALAKEPGFVPLVGAKTRAQLGDALGALERPLSASDVSALESLVPADAIAGTRYGMPQMAHLDSEK